ncbi:MAG: hypothetical protein FWC47_03100 [Oscillospiraceae bacterium]|nr:hypothetical protein [Oscillospiraceae bacterium]
MEADPLVGGVALYANTIKCWDGEKDNMIDSETLKKIVKTIRTEFAKYPESKSEIVD